MRISIQMTNRWPLERFAEIVGVGNVRGPWGHTVNWKPRYGWSVCNYEGCVHVINLLWDYLSPERQAQIERVAATFKEQRKAS